MDSIYVLKWLGAAVPAISFFVILWALLDSKYSRRTTLWAVLGFLIVEVMAQAAVFAVSKSPELVATMLPLTFHLPAILCFHLLSRRQFFPTALAWLIALLCDCLLAALRKLLIVFQPALGGPVWAFVLTVSLVLAAVFLLVLIFRQFRVPFLAYTQEQASGWPPLLFLPVMLLALHSYFLSSTTNATVLILLFLTALSAFLLLARLISSLDAERLARQTRQQMETLRQSYEIVQKKLELGRGYRHDMRHHMAALTTLLQQGDCESAQRYISSWQGQLTQIETEAWCKNTAVNGVLSAYLAQAREIGCALDVEAALPSSVPFEETDLCVVLANALENAIHACEKLPQGTPRRLKLSLALADQRRLTIRVENSCPEDVELDSRGFPTTPPREGHGLGLKNIAAVAEKYHGLFQCDCVEGVFTLRVVLLDAAKEPRHSHRLGAAALGAFFCFFLINCMPALAQALEAVPVLGAVVRVVDLQSYSFSWGSTGISVEKPVLDGSEQAVDEIEQAAQEWIRQMEEQFIWYAARKYQGYTATDISHTVIRDDEDMFILRFDATLNAGGSVNYSRYFTLDRQTGQILTLADLFLPESNYAFPISREIKAQMAEQMKAGEANYFLPGGIWSDEECFQSIEDDQSFYINNSGQLVIVFDEYEVAPGSMGMPEFVIPSSLLNGLLVQPSVLR